MVPGLAEWGGRVDKDEIQSLEAGLRLSPWVVVALVALLGFTVGTWGELTSPQPGRALDYQFLAEVLALVAGLLCYWRPALGRWCALIGLALAVHLLDAWAILPGTQALMAVPVAAGAWLMGPPAAAALAAGQTILLTLPWLWPAPVGPALRSPNAPVQTQLGGTLALMWIAVGGSFALAWRQRRLARWSWEYYHLARLSDGRPGYRFEHLERVPVRGDLSTPGGTQADLHLSLRLYHALWPRLGPHQRGGSLHGPPRHRPLPPAAAAIHRGPDAGRAQGMRRLP